MVVIYKFFLGCCQANASDLGTETDCDLQGGSEDYIPESEMESGYDE